MSINDRLIIEELKLQELIKAQQKAQDYYLSELESYCNSGDGSEAQERRRDDHMARVQEKRDSASQAVDSQQRLIESLKKQLHE